MEATIDSGRNHGKKYQASTVKVWKEWATQFNNFQKECGKLNWEDISLDVYYSYISFFYERNYAVNSVGKQIKMLKTILRKSYEAGLHRNEAFRAKKFRVLTDEIDKVTLSLEEVNNIYTLDLPLNSQIDFHRDIFLIGCYSALRLSDVRRINETHVFERGNKRFLKMRMKKTDDTVMIPINSNLDTILKRYNYKIPKITEQYLRKDIKKICNLANINELIEVKSTKGGKIEYLKKHKFEVVSSHTARRTGATNMYLSGMRLFEIQKITGHKKEINLLKYINVSIEDNASHISSNPFFN